MPKFKAIITNTIDYPDPKLYEMEAENKRDFVIKVLSDICCDDYSQYVDEDDTILDILDQADSTIKWL